MTTFTPGPWELRRDRQEGVFGIRMGSLYMFGLIGEANARLAVSAPDLLAALKRNAPDWCYCDPDDSRVPVCAGCEARAAIAKATGGSDA
jgi:hypothetical protein